MDTITVANHIEGTHAITLDDALKIRALISPRLQAGQKTRLDFTDVTVLGCFLVFLFHEMYQSFHNAADHVDADTISEDEQTPEDTAKETEFLGGFKKNPLPAEPEKILEHLSFVQGSEEEERILRDFSTCTNLKERKEARRLHKVEMESQMEELLHDVEAAPELTDETTILTKIAMDLFRQIPDSDKEQVLQKIRETHGETIETWTKNQDNA
jgi:hypothetical protein